MKLFRKVIKLELDFLVQELKTLHKIKKLNDDLQNRKKL